jgi:hypothetical protein
MDTKREAGRPITGRPKTGRVVAGRFGLVLACGVLAVAGAACGSGSSSGAQSGRSSSPSTRTSAVPSTGSSTGPSTPPTTGTAGSSTAAQLATVQQQLASVPGLLSQAQQANGAADPDQARAAEGG